VESMVRDLVEMSVRIIKDEKLLKVQDTAEKEANKRLVELLVPQTKKQTAMKNPFEMLFTNQGAVDGDTQEEQTKNDEIRNKRQQVERLLAMGELEEKIVSVEVIENQPSMFDLLQGSGMEQMGMNM